MATDAPRRIVVVDNDPDALELAATDLRFEGHEIVGQALDGETAIELCRELNPDVLVVDHRMPPGPWGLEVARRVRQELPEIDVIIYSNYQSVDLITSTKAIGATFLPKGNLRALRKAVAPRP